MYNFDKITTRRGSCCYKWDEPETDDIIPMWVADMDFEVAPEITAAIHKRADHAIFGYVQVPQTYFDSVKMWLKRRHSWEISTDWIIQTTGVIPAISAILKALTLPSEEVVLMTPAYNHFFTSIANNGCVAVESPLVQEDGRWVIDYDDLEEKCRSERARCLLLCNPHNPVGRVWTREELKRVGEICKRNNVVVIADEIHCDIIMPGYKYIPFASISDECSSNCVTCMSPSKGFNIAGLQIANIICSDADRRYRVNRCINLNECCEVNPFGVVALQAAYNEGGRWLDEMCEYVNGNYQLLADTLAQSMPQLHVSHLEGTYLAWVDIRETGMTSDEYTQHLLDDARVMVSSGTMYHGEGFIRVNLACPRQRLAEALERMVKCK